MLSLLTAHGKVLRRTSALSLCFYRFGKGVQLSAKKRGVELKGVMESYVQLIQDMYRDSQTHIRCADGLGEPFYVTVGLL